MQSSEFGPDVFDPEVPRSLSSGGKDEFDFNVMNLTNIAHPMKETFVNNSNQLRNQTNLQLKLR